MPSAFVASAAGGRLVERRVLPAAFGELLALVEDPSVTDLFCNGPGQVWVDHGGGLERVSIRWLAERFGDLLGKEAIITGTEGQQAWLFDASLSYDWFGPPTVTLDEMLAATAAWVRQGGQSLGKPTHFESHDGKF